MKKFIVLLTLIAVGSLSAAIIDTVRSMPDNSWIMLPENGPKPITRSSSNRMHYDGDSVGYLWGCSHADNHNDLWSFNVATNKWREVIPTEASAQTDPMVIKNQDSILQTRAGRPLSFHQWSSMDWNSDAKQLWRVCYDGWQGLYSGHDSVICQYQPGPTCNVHTKCKVMGKYDPQLNQWSPVKYKPFSWPLTCSTCGNEYIVFRYIPYLKKFVCIVWGYFSDTYVLADPATLTLQTVKATLQPISGDGGDAKVSQLGGAVWDSFREVLIFVGSGTGTWAFNPKTMVMKQIVSTANSPVVWTDCATSHMVYDANNQTTLVFTTPGMQTCYGGGTWPSRAAVYTLDYEGGKWNLLPAPSSGQSPTNTGAQHFHSYFDQNMGVIFLFEGGYNANNGVKWLYKYKAVSGIPRIGAATENTRKAIDGKDRILFSSNPARGQILIQSNVSTAYMDIFDIRGKKISRIAGSRGNWNPARYPNGIYLVSAAGGKLTAKLVLDR
jgi:hypothetical protein